MNNKETHLAVAWPDEEDEREKLREMFEDVPLPAKVPDSLVMPCQQCGLKLTVGPRVRAKVATDGIPLWCVLCAVKDAKAHDRIEVRSLDNPDSREEDLWEGD